MDLQLLTPFVESTCSILKQMTDIDVSAAGEPQDQEGVITSYGVASIISFSGKIKGRFLLDMTPTLAVRVTSTLLGELHASLRDRMLAAAVSELNNIICGDANTALNNRFQYGLRLAPPIVFTGSGLTVSVSQIDSVTACFESACGAMKINVGFMQ